MSRLFDKELIDSYISNTDPKNYDYEEEYNKGILALNVITKYYYILSKSQLEESHININSIVNSTTCDYLNGYMNYTLNTKELEIDYIIIGKVKPIIGGYELSSETLCGILVAQKGECSTYPSYWTVRLICNLSDNTSCKGYGTKLLGLYMASLLRMKEIDIRLGLDYQKYGVLELAGSYTNLAGYCAYSKFGFIENFNFECPVFQDYNLTMTTDIDDITLTDIYNIVINNTRYKTNRHTGVSERIKKRPVCLYENTQFKDAIIHKLEEFKTRGHTFKKVTKTDENERKILQMEKKIINQVIKEDLERNKRINNERREKAKTEKEFNKLCKELDLMELASDEFVFKPRDEPDIEPDHGRKRSRSRRRKTKSKKKYRKRS